MIAGSLQSEAHFRFEHDPDRERTVLRTRRAGGLCHLSKPYWDGHVLGAQIINPTAGWFNGDTLGLDLEVGDSARVAVTSPSANRFYAMDDGRAVIEQRIRLGRGAWLEFRPEWTIPQGGSEAQQHTRVELGPESSLVFFDFLAPGRVAHGESHRYRRFESSFELRREGRLQVRERMVLEPGSDGWPLAVAGWENCFYGALWVAAGDAEAVAAALTPMEKNIDGTGLHVGVSRLDEDLVAMRVLASSSRSARRVLAEARTALAKVIPCLQGGTRTL